jgi:hypothetical protein
LVHAERALEKFGSPELRKALVSSGLGNHPQLVDFCVKIGRAMKEDTVVLPGAAVGGRRTPEEILYGGEKK